MEAILKQIFILSIFTLVVSCRVTPHDENMGSESTSSNESVSVKINFLGVEWSNEINEKPKIQSSIQALDENSFTQIKEIPEIPENEKYLADLGLDLESATTEYIQKGAKILIIAYKNNGDTYTFHKEHIIELGKNFDFRLDSGQNYTLIIVSTGTEKLPVIHNTNDINSSYFSFDRNLEEGQYLYRRIDYYVPRENITDLLNIKLKKRTVGVRIVLDASRIIGGHTGKKIISINNAKLTYRTLPVTNDLRFS